MELALTLHFNFIFSQKKAFLIFPEMEPCTFQHRVEKKIKKIHPKKISYTSGNENTPKNAYIFSKESFSYISENENLRKTSYISGNGSPEKIPNISGSNFKSTKSKKNPL